MVTLISQIKKEFNFKYFKTENIAFVDQLGLLPYLKTQIPNFNNEIEKLGLVVIICFEQPIDAI